MKKKPFLTPLLSGIAVCITSSIFTFNISETAAATIENDESFIPSLAFTTENIDIRKATDEITTHDDEDFKIRTSIKMKMDVELPPEPEHEPEPEETKEKSEEETEEVNTEDLEKTIEEETEQQEIEKVSTENIENTDTDTENSYSETVKSKVLYTLDQFKHKGIVHWNNIKWSYYSETVLPGSGLRIPGRHVNEDGFVSDKDGYIVLAAPSGIAHGSIFETPFGVTGKIYDTCGGCTGGNNGGSLWLDVYVH